VAVTVSVSVRVYPTGDTIEDIIVNFLDVESYVTQAGKTLMV
jgi:hypothetical protein